MKKWIVIGLVNVLFAVGVVAVWAENQENVAAATKKWAEAFNANNIDSILALYDEEAVLWGTTSPTLRTTSDKRHEYFTGPFGAAMEKKITELKVEFGDSVIRVYGDTAINTGYYTFSWVKDGETTTLPARFSFTYVKRDGEWKIVDHHSSKIPQ